MKIRASFPSLKFILLVSFFAGVGAGADCTLLVRKTALGALYGRFPAVQSLAEGPLSARIGETARDSAFHRFQETVAHAPIADGEKEIIAIGDSEFTILGNAGVSGDEFSVSIYAIQDRRVAELGQSNAGPGSAFLKFARALFLGIDQRLLANPNAFRRVKITGRLVGNERLLGTLKKFGFLADGPNYTLEFLPGPRTVP